MDNPSPYKYYCGGYSYGGVLEQAKEELAYETWRQDVEAAKIKLLTKKPWYVKLFPFKVIIERV